MAGEGLYTARLHLNGCLRLVHIDDQLPFHETSDASPSSAGASLASGQQRRLMCASVRPASATSPDIEPAPAILLPSLVEKACLSVLRTYAPPGSVPAEDLHLLTGWLPEVVHLQGREQDSSSTSADSQSASATQGSQAKQASLSSLIQREKTFRRVYEAWVKGRVLICAGTGSGSSGGGSEGATATGIEKGLVPSHSYAVLDIDDGQRTSGRGGDRSLTLMNPWRLADGPSKEEDDSSSNANLYSFSRPTSASSLGGKNSPFTLSWERFLHSFSTLHLAWNPLALFTYVDEVHGSWERGDEASVEGSSASANAGEGEGSGTPSQGEEGGAGRAAAVRDTTFTLRVTAPPAGSAEDPAQGEDYESNSSGGGEGAGEVWLHLTRHSKKTRTSTHSSGGLDGEPFDNNGEGEKMFIAVHIYESTAGGSEGFQSTRVVPLGGERGSSAVSDE